MTDPAIYARSLPAEWEAVRGKFLFPQRNTKGYPYEEMLTASQKFGVIPQKLYEELTEMRAMSAFKGLENFKLVNPSDFVISLRSFQGGIEHSAHRGIISPAYTVMRAARRVEPRFFRYALKEAEFIARLNGVCTGIRDGKTIRYDEFAELELPVPPLATQRAIADFLDRKTVAIDDLIAKKERLIELLEEKRAALINQAVTKGLDPNVPMKDSGIPWIGEIPAHWRILPLRRGVERFVDYRGRTPERSESGVPLVTATCVRNGIVDHSRRPDFVTEETYREWMVRGFPEVGEVVFTTEGATFGETGRIVDATVALAQRLILFKVNEVELTNEYLYYYLVSRAGFAEMESRTTGTTVFGISADNLRAAYVPLPPLEEQRAIAVELGGGDLAVVGTIRSQIEKLREYRQSLITAAVTGQLDIEAGEGEAA